MARSREAPPQGPYLTLTIPEALSLPKSAAPERQRYEHVVDLLEHRAKHQADTVAVGFSELKEEGTQEWTCRTISASGNALVLVMPPPDPLYIRTAQPTARSHP